MQVHMTYIQSGKWGFYYLMSLKPVCSLDRGGPPPSSHPCLYSCPLALSSPLPPTNGGLSFILDNQWKLPKEAQLGHLNWSCPRWLTLLHLPDAFCNLPGS